jgi:2'-5' RNA ligase
VPEGAAHDALQAVVDRLAQEHGGPAFPPHVTLLGSLTTAEDDVVASARRLAARIAPFTIHLDDLDVGETYFQSLFATVRPSPALLAAREAAEHAFPDAPSAPFRSHLSLLYGSPPAATKPAIVEALRGTLPPAFEARLLVVNQTGGAVEAWRRVLGVELAG